MKKASPLFCFSIFLLFIPFWVQAQININVDEAPYHAVGDGVTDDHDAIQEAIWDLRGAGGTLTFTSGKTYLIATGLTFNTFPSDKNYLVTSTGTEKAIIKVKGGENTLSWNHWGIRLSESRNITLKNLRIDGNRAERNPIEETSGSDVLFIDGASNGTRLENLELVNSPMDNIYIVVHTNQNQTMMTDFEMHNCKLDNAFRNNMSVISGANFKIIGCEFTNAIGTNPQAGIDFEPNSNSPTYSNMLVEGCLFKGNENFGLMLTYIVEGAGNSIIKDNFFDNNGVLVASKNNLIHHNIFVNQDHWHHTDADVDDRRNGIIYFHTGLTATGNEVYNNYFYDNNMPANSHLIYFMHNSGGDNSVHDNYAHGNNAETVAYDDTNPATQPGQTLTNNIFLANREMGFWNMDAAQINANTINDLSDFNNNGTITGATSVPGVENEALDFAPDDKYITVPANDNLNIEMNITVMAWVKWAGLNAAENQQVFVGRGDDWRFGVSNNGHIGFHAPLTKTLVQSPANALPTNQWKHVTATYSGRNVKLYIDGNEVANERVNGSLTKNLANLFIGSFNTNTYSFNGTMDDVRIYNYPLEQAKIQEIVAASPLSVEWLAPLTAIKNGKHVQLKWTVAQQVNNEKFIIEHSTDGINFEPIQEVVADGNLANTKEFRALHQNPINGDNFYRIKQIDLDGHSDFSNIAFVRFEGDAISIYPNPAHQEINLSTKKSILRQIDIYNITGQLVYSLAQKENHLTIENLPIGIYWIKITEGNQVSVSRFTKE